jgi:HSP20 family protein
MTVVKFNNRPGKSFSLDNFFNEIPAFFKDDPATDNWNGGMPVNIKETEGNYLLEVIAPGMDKSDFKVNLDKNILTVSAEKKNEVKDEKEKQIRREYSYRSFKRSFTLDEKIEAEKIEAKYVNGVLTLNLPKKTEVKASAKEISIQ